MVIVSGWYTPNYKLYHRRLVQQLDKKGLEHDFIAVEPIDQHWEAATRKRPYFLQEALERNPGKIILAVDVDCYFRGTKEQIEKICDIQSDIAFYMIAKIRKRTGALKMHPAAGGLVLRHTPNTLKLLEVWADLGNQVSKPTNDEATLGLALTRVPGLQITLLPVQACAGSNLSDALIVHPHRTGIRSSKLRHLWWRLFP